MVLSRAGNGPDSIGVKGDAPVKDWVGLAQRLCNAQGIQCSEGIGPEADRTAFSAGTALPLQHSHRDAHLHTHLSLRSQELTASLPQGAKLECAGNKTLCRAAAAAKPAIPAPTISTASSEDACSAAARPHFGSARSLP